MVVVASMSVMSLLPLLLVFPVLILTFLCVVFDLTD